MQNTQKEDVEMEDTENLEKRSQDKEYKIDNSIKLKRVMIQQADNIEDEDFDLNDAFTISSIEKRDKLLAKAFYLECNQRSHVVFDDAEAPILADFVGTAPRPIIVYDTDLQPLDQMLTDFINKPEGLLADYLVPEFDDIKAMLKAIREKGDCPLYERFVPNEGTQEFDDYVKKIINQIRLKIHSNRYQNFFETYDNESRGEENKSSLQECSHHHIGAPHILNDRLTERLEKMKSDGELKKEEEPPKDDVDDLVEILYDAKSETQSETEASTSTAHQKKKKKENVDPDVIELGSDESGSESVENADKLDAAKRLSLHDCGKRDGENSELNQVSDDEIDVFTDPEDCIKAGESAISPSISPEIEEDEEEKNLSNNDEKKNDDGGDEDEKEEEDNDQEVICID